MSQSALSPTSRSADPLHRLPYETWLHCMKFAVEESAAGPLPYLAVSSEWSTTIIDTPSLWTSIVIDNGEDEAARVQVFIQLSRQQLVDVIYVNSKDGSMLHYVLQECASRVSSIVYSPQLLFRETNEDNFLMVLNETTLELPALKTLIGVRNVPVPRRLLSAGPNLRIIRESPVSIIDEPYMGLMVEEVRMDFESTSDIFQLSQRRGLRSLSTTLPPVPPSSLEEDNESTSQSMLVEQLSITVGYQPTSLSITLSFESFWTFAALLSAFLRLYSLDLSVNLTEKGLVDEVAPLITLGNIRSLSLEFHGSGWNGSDDEDDDEPVLEAQASIILRSFIVNDVLQDVETLHFCANATRCRDDDLGRWIRSALNVHTLSVISSRLIKGEVSSPRQAHSPMLYLNVAWLEPPVLFNLFNAPNLTDLTFPNTFMSSNPTFEWREEGFGPNLIKLSTTATLLYPIKSPYSPPLVAHTVKNLIITDSELKLLIDYSNFDHFCEARSSLQWLCEVSFDSGEHWGSASPEFANQFLYFLYGHPETCPHLAKIKILGYPFWELLFEVIRQRYFSHVQSITQISFPRLPMYGILYLLVGCLGGTEDAYSGRDIDEVISRRIGSKYNHACGHCTRGGYIYCVDSPTSAGENMFDQSFEEEQDTFHLNTIKYHAIPYTFKSFLEELDTGPRLRKESKPVCDWQLSYDWVDITEHTLDGMSIAPWSMQNLGDFN